MLLSLFYSQYFYMDFFKCRVDGVSYAFGLSAYTYITDSS